MALVVYTNQSKHIITYADSPDSFDELGRPDISFIHSVIESNEIESIYDEDPAVLILIDGIQYSLLLCDQAASIKRLPINIFATKLAVDMKIIDSMDTIRGTVIFIELSELSEN